MNSSHVVPLCSLETALHNKALYSLISAQTFEKPAALCAIRSSYLANCMDEFATIDSCAFSMFLLRIYMQTIA